MRLIPTQDHECHVCGTVYAVHSRFDGGDVIQEPTVCPACGAPRRSAWPIESGRAKGLLLALAGYPPFVEQFGDAATYLRGLTRSPAEVDAYLELVRAIDYDDWEASYGGAGSREERDERDAVRSLRARAQSGGFERELAELAADVKRQQTLERDRHLAIFERRQGATGAAQ